MPPEDLPRSHDVVEAAPPVLPHAVGVVHLARAVDAETDEEAVLREERCPLVVEERAVRLDRVLEHLARTGELVRERDRTPEEVEPHQRRLAALPGHHDLAVRVRGEQLLQVTLQRRICHPQTVTWIQRVLGEEEAIRAVEVADRSSRLGQQMERPTAQLRILAFPCSNCSSVITPCSRSWTSCAIWLAGELDPAASWMYARMYSSCCLASRTACWVILSPRAIR